MRSPKRKIWILFIMIFILACSTVVVYAYLSAQSGSVQNNFSAASGPNPSIQESTNSPLTLKENVTVDVGAPGYAVYVRVAIVINWEDANGHILGQKPVAGTDYVMNLNIADSDKWFYNSADGFYYYEEMISSGETDVLIESCYQAGESPSATYKLNVQIIAQTIQALGTTDGNDPIPAVTDAWGVYIVDGKLSVTAPPAS